MIRRLFLVAALALTPFAAMSAPAAFPATEPGVTELKTLPAGLLVRSETGGNYFENGGNLFRPLFRYIQRKDIAMTTPVEVGVGAPSAMYFWIAEAERTKAEPDLASATPAGAAAASSSVSSQPKAAGDEPQTSRQSLIDKMPEASATGSPATGSPAGGAPAGGAAAGGVTAGKTLPEGVVVLTRPERLVVSHGGRGSYTRAHFEEARNAALEWLAARPDLVADGEACAVYWNSPFMPGFLKRYEVHIPVRAVAKPTS